MARRHAAWQRARNRSRTERAHVIDTFGVEILDETTFRSPANVDELDEVGAIARAPTEPPRAHVVPFAATLRRIA